MKILFVFLGLVFFLNLNVLSFNFKLNPPFAEGGYVYASLDEHIGFAMPDKDSGSVIYLANPLGILDDTNFKDLFKVPIAGGFPINLTEGLMLGASGGQVGGSRFLISPDLQRVVFQATTELFVKPFELYSVDLNNPGAPVKLNQPFAPGQAGIEQFEISSDSQRVVYRANPQADLDFLLYSVPIAGGAVTTLTPLLHPDTFVVKFSIAPDAQRVVFVSDYTVDEVGGYYSVPITGGAVTQLNGLLGGIPNGQKIHISPDSQKVVYQDLKAISDVYVVPIQGGNSIKLNTPAMGTSGSPTISPNNSRVVMIGNKEIYSVSINGGNPVKISKPNVVNGAVTSYQISSNSARVVYMGDVEVDEKYELFSVPITGGTVTKLNKTLGSSLNSLQDVISFSISSNSTRVVYLADADTDKRDEVFSVPIAGGNSVKLSIPLQADQDAERVKITPDSNRVIYVVNKSPQELWQDEFYSVSITGGVSKKLNGPLVQGGTVGYYNISPFSTRLVYAAEEDILGMPELYEVTNP